MSVGVEPKAATSSMRKRRFSLFIATAAGLGYLPKAPGTWGSIGGLLLTWFFLRYHQFGDPFTLFGLFAPTVPYSFVAFALVLLIAFLGVWSSSVTSRITGIKDPQFVVIDEVSGQMITLLLGAGVTTFTRTRIYDIWTPEWNGFVNWKYLLLGFILFRLFDIWKPFPARQAESLPGGWGIMADDWIAALYAAIGLWIARAAGL
jgi:phosphatidylglycerophosphatase A